MKRVTGTGALGKTRWRPSFRYAGVRVMVPWSRAWALAAVFVLRRFEDAIYAGAYLLGLARIRLLEYLRAPLNVIQWP